MANTALTVQALVSRLVPSITPPLTSREFWMLKRLVDIAELPSRSSDDLTREFGIHPEVADRVPALLERSRSLALALEQLEHQGIWAITGESPGYPERLRARLGDNAPALLTGVGDLALLDQDGIGVVGSRDITPVNVRVARAVAGAAASRGLPTISGAARGVDQEAMRGAFDSGGTVVGVVADSLLRALNEPSTRQAVADGRVCLLTPYAPSAPFSAGNAMGRNKIIYGLSHAVVVVRSDHETGGTWAGAKEALNKKYSTVFSWTGDGAGPGNLPLVSLGAHALASDDDLAATLFATPSVEPVMSARDSLPLPLF